MKQLWETLVNAESKEGWWDITFLKGGGVNISKWSDDQREMQIEVSVAEWKDLCELVNRITKP